MYGNQQESKLQKQPLKRVQISLNKFNDVAVPHYVDLLNKHRSNIEKFQQMADFDKVHREQINATRQVQQLKNMLSEMDMLRNQVQESDLIEFDKITAASFDAALKAIKSYLDMNPPQHPIWLPSKTEESREAKETLSEESSPYEEVSASDELLQCSKQEQDGMTAADLVKKEACLRSWENLQGEVQDVHQIFQDLSLIVHEQKEKVDLIEDNVETTADNVSEGTKQLARAARLKGAMYPLAGALIGCCVGGPVGLLAGIKLGSLAAFGCGVVGFTSGRYIKKRQEATVSSSEVELQQLQLRNMKGSVSLPNISEDKDYQESKKED